MTGEQSYFNTSTIILYFEHIPDAADSLQCYGRFRFQIFADAADEDIQAAAGKAGTQYLTFFNNDLKYPYLQ